jgi:hypothetical protein
MHYHGRKTMRLVSKTLDMDLADIKSKFISANQGNQQAAQKISSVKSTHRLSTRPSPR